MRVLMTRSAFTVNTSNISSASIGRSLGIHLVCTSRRQVEAANARVFGDNSLWATTWRRRL